MIYLITMCNIAGVYDSNISLYRVIIFFFMELVGFNKIMRVDNFVALRELIWSGVSSLVIVLVRRWLFFLVK